MSNKPAYKIWCDGSHRSGKNIEKELNGGGFVMREGGSGEEYNYSRLFNSLCNSHQHGSMIAEIRAITAALCAAPKSHHIKVYNDNRGVVRALQTRELSERVQQKSGYALSTAFRQAMMAIQRHGHVSFEHSHRSSDMMRKAHKLAYNATKPPKAKAA